MSPRRIIVEEDFEEEPETTEEKIRRHNRDLALNPEFVKDNRKRVPTIKVMVKEHDHPIIIPAIERDWYVKYKGAKLVEGSFVDGDDPVQNAAVARVLRDSPVAPVVQREVIEVKPDPTPDSAKLKPSKYNFAQHTVEELYAFMQDAGMDAPQDAGKTALVATLKASGYMPPLEEG